MACFRPLRGWYKSGGGITFRFAEGCKDRPMEVPCGKCVGCRLEYSRQWAVRCVHESMLWQNNVFVTLTYAESPGTLVPKDFQDFMKRLRWEYGDGIRFFQCGEYGEELGRPHHHALLFNHAFEDAKLYKESATGALYTSKRLERLWGHGRCAIGGVSFESAGYIARYTLKRAFGLKVGEGRVPEYLTMSRRPGIGRGFIDKYRVQIYKQDFVVSRGHKCRPPRYYDLVEEAEAPEVLAKVKSRRRVAAAESIDNTLPRLDVREQVTMGAIGLLRRSLENGYGS